MPNCIQVVTTFKISVSVTYMETMTAQVTLQQKYCLFYIPALNYSSFVSFIPGSLLLFCIRKPAWGSFLLRDHFCDSTVIIMHALQMQNVSTGRSFRTAAEKNAGFVYC